VTYSESRSGSTILDACLMEDAREMIGHRAFADHEFLGDLAVALALGHQSQYLCLTRAESGRQMWPGSFPSKLMQSFAQGTLKCLGASVFRQNQGLF
jgi:hypothetical protein